MYVNRPIITLSGCAVLVADNKSPTNNNTLSTTTKLVLMDTLLFSDAYGATTS